MVWYFALGSRGCSGPHRGDFVMGLAGHPITVCDHRRHRGCRPRTFRAMAEAGRAKAAHARHARNSNSLGGTFSALGAGLLFGYIAADRVTFV